MKLGNHRKMKREREKVVATKTVSTRVAIVGKGGRCSGGNSAIDKAAYISRCTMYSEYDGQHHYPKYSEDLVHSEVMLPKNAPEEYANPEILWNSVEMFEKKNSRAQLARTYRIELPNEWSYELAIKAMQEYIKENFVDDGMCAQYAIHDSVNKKSGQRNLHCHIMLTMRPILKDGSWGDKQKKVYILDENGNKIRTKKGNYKCTTQDVTGWSSRENAKKWRKNLTDLINRINQEMGYDENFWEYRSFAERGLEQIPQIHLGEKASALERNGIQTERGNINRMIQRSNISLKFHEGSYNNAVKTLENVIADVKKSIEHSKNEILQFLDRQLAKNGRLLLPIKTGIYLRKAMNRDSLQDIENAKKYINENEIDSFDKLIDRMDRLTSDYEKSHSDENRALGEQKELRYVLDLYNSYCEYKKYHDESKSLKGWKKERYDKAHREELDKYDTYRMGLINVSKQVNGTASITPKKWNADYQSAENVIMKAREMRPDIEELALLETVLFNKQKEDELKASANKEHFYEQVVNEPGKKKKRDLSL